jgi:hypothetical protein
MQLLHAGGPPPVSPDPVTGQRSVPTPAQRRKSTIAIPREQLRRLLWDALLQQPQADEDYLVVVEEQPCPVVQIRWGCHVCGLFAANSR